MKTMRVLIALCVTIQTASAGVEADKPLFRPGQKVRSLPCDQLKRMIYTGKKAEFVMGDRIGCGKKGVVVKQVERICARAMGIHDDICEEYRYVIKFEGMPLDGLNNPVDVREGELRGSK